MRVRFNLSGSESEVSDGAFVGQVDTIGLHEAVAAKVLSSAWRNLRSREDIICFMSDDVSKRLKQLGWDSFFHKHYQKLKTSGSVPARVISESKGAYQILCQYGELTARISGKMRYHAGVDRQYPSVGDWVVLKPVVEEGKGTISAILPRKSTFSRKIVEETTEEQVVCVNVDTVFIVSALDGGRNFNPRRIERYLTLAKSSGAAPVIVLNKVDLCEDVDECIRDVEAMAIGISVHTVSATELTGLDALRNYLTEGKTVAFLGSSGVGKSALINALLGVERQDTCEVRDEDRMGRHTTIMRELILLPEGGMVIDTPGMREIQMWAGEEVLQDSFSDIEMISRECRFTNCSHDVESGCAAKAAIERGALDPARLESYRKQRKQLNLLSARQAHNTRARETLRWKKISQRSKET